MIRSGTSLLRQQAEQTFSAATQTLREEAERLMNAQKGRAVQRLSHAGNSMRRTAHALHAINVGTAASYAESAADRLNDVADYIDGANLDDLAEDASAVVKRHRAATIGGLFVAGLLAARFLKATQQEHAGQQNGERATEKPQRVAVRRKRPRRNSNN